MKYKTFSIFKNTYKKEGEKTPDYKIMISKGEGEKFEEAGGCWIREGKNGKFFSCKLNDIYVDHTKNLARKGFALTLESALDSDEKPEIREPKQEVVVDDEIPF